MSSQFPNCQTPSNEKIITTALHKYFLEMTVQFPLSRHEQKEYMNLLAEKLGRLSDSIC